MGFAIALALAAASAASGDAAEAFQRMKRLEGSWKGSFTWTPGGRSGPMDASYRVSGNGTALIEDLLSDGKPIMTTAYHLDGGDLRMTHFCGAGNQPRLKAGHIDLSRNVFA